MAWEHVSELYLPTLRYGDFRPGWVTENTELAKAFEYDQTHRPGYKFDPFGHVDSRATAWAAEFGAALLLADPDRNAIDHEVRRRVRLTVQQGLENALTERKLADAIQQLGYGPTDAVAIARTEDRLALGYGALCGMIAVGMSCKRWLISNDPGVCEACLANHAQGWIPILEPFASGAMAAIDHPGCRCDVVSTRHPA